MRSLAKATRAETHVYFTGGVSAVLMGWRESTIDIDLSMFPDRDELFRAIPALKEDLEVNVELASPAQFLPELPEWRGRSVFIVREGAVSFSHYDFYSQALAKIERAHAQDRSDVAAMLARGLIEPKRLRELFEKIESGLYRYPAVDPSSLRRGLNEALAASESAG